MTAKRDRRAKKSALRTLREMRKMWRRSFDQHNDCWLMCEDLPFYAPVKFDQPTFQLRIQLPEAS